MDSGIGVVVALGAFFVWALVIWNRLVALRKRVTGALTLVMAQLQRRHELAGELVESSRGRLHDERGALQAVAGARDAAVTAARDLNHQDARAMEAVARSEQTLSSALNRLLALAEASADLQADDRMRRISHEMTTTDTGLGPARKAFNDAVQDFNAALEAFPAVMFAGLLGFRAAVPLAPLDAHAAAAGAA